MDSSLEIIPVESLCSILKDDIFTEKFQIPGEESAVVPHLENEDFTTELKTFRVKRNQVQQVLARLDESKSVGLDGVSPRVLKQCATVLSMPLT